jgi:hypothetical protein
MAVPSNTFQRSNKVSVRESLHDTISNISPTQTPFISNIGSGSANQTYEEWLTDTLAAPDPDNAVINGDDAANDALTDAVRLGNYTQLMDKVVGISTTAQAVKSAGNHTKMSVQMLKKSKEIKRDMESRACGNFAAVPLADGTAGKTAGMVAFIRTNGSRGAGGAAATLSGTTSGYVDAAATNGTLRTVTEDMLKDAIQDAWNEGGEPSMALMSGTLKQKFSTFSGIADLRRDAPGNKAATIIGAADVYVSDFGNISFVPSRFTTGRDVSIIDPSLWTVLYLQRFNTTDLAKTGHADRKLLSVEWTLKCANELGNANIADVQAA